MWVSRVLAGRVLFVAVGVVAAAGCGSDDDSKTTAKAPEQAAPKELLGSYTTTLKQSDLPSNPAQELTEGSPARRV
jgi:hypothetical protein